MGASDAAYGPLIPYLESYYDISHTTVSLLFLSPVCGYTLAGLLNNEIHVQVGRRGIACISAACHLFTFSIASLHPRYPVLVVSSAVGGFGTGIADSAWNAWISSLSSANQLMGILHGLYGVGAMISPLIVSALVTRANVPWFRFYNIMAAGAAVEAVVCTLAFWSARPVTLDASEDSDESQRGGLRRALFQQPYARVTWICTLFLLIYVGTEVTLGGWTVVFMMRVRHATPFASGMAVTGFWLGITCGRVFLGFITPMIGEELSVTLYALCVIIFGFVFWLVPNFYVSAVAVSLQGFFLGPLFPVLIVVATKILPQSLHVSSIGFASAIGGAGAALLPFAVGSLAESQGVQILQPFIIGLSVGILLLWLCLWRVSKSVAGGICFDTSP
ncbi:MFS transporter [Aspergillus sclerotioniger CBS 115572]|uniref:MFS transporter n=1 Tax=Aspergillus sclerotioniger CBS 115572 TaxID=1450535 RepID=A0A317V482_9EURO|nr:MFS transporter [Aspergillus sclerotioniger CBS 115572]PWY67647.1 MFS transporter [Aspergillus sclerotioniger CBS 115572]